MRVNIPRPQHRFILLLVALQLLVVIPFRFANEFGERDSYRMFLGLIDTIKSGSLFDSSLLYNREASFGYYSFLYALTPLAGSTPRALISAMNWIGVFSVVLFTVPMFIVTDRLFGRWVAICAGVVVIATPVWWHCSLYAHPITTAMLLFFSGLALLCRQSTMPSPAVRMTALVLFGGALTFRLDIALLYPALIAVLWEIRPAKLLKEAALYIIGSLVLFGAGKHFLPAVASGDAPDSILALLVRFHNPAHMLSGVRDSIIYLGQGFTPVLLITVPISLWLLVRRKRYPLLLFVSGVILENVIFWLTNSSPPRHYLSMVPAMAISVALVLEALPSANALLAGAAAAMVVIGTSLALNQGKGYLGYFPSQFEDRFTMQTHIAEASRIAEQLVHLPSLETPVVVLCDSNLVIAEMEKLAPDTSALFRTVKAGPSLIGVHDVHQGGNRFIMVEESWEESQVSGFDRSGEYPAFPVLAASYLPYPYFGTRQLLAVKLR